MKKPNWSTEKMATGALYALLALSAVVFAAFYLVAYSTPWEENPDFTAPLLTGVLTTFLLVLVLVALGTAGWSMVNAFRQRDREETGPQHIPGKRLSIGVAALTVILLALTFLTGSTAALPINGRLYEDAFWLRTADMFIRGGAALMALAALLVLVSYCKSRLRKS